ncbi:MAG: drug/metabolite transporter (DMT)-like permease [Parasphingorhabdus sp.]|jgi:drug/metabolite transporter (DMT)-like permease
MKLFPLAMFWLLGIIWGSNFIYMKLASELISPLQIVLLRVLFGLLPVAIYAYWKSALKWQHLKHIGHFLVMALIGTIAYYYGFAKGTSLLLSSVSGALSGLTSITSFIIALIFLQDEKSTLQKALGIGIGFLGVVLIANPFGHSLTHTSVEGVIYNLVGSIGVGTSFVYAKKYILKLDIPVSAIITYQLALSLIILIFVTDLQGIGNIWTDRHVAAGLVIGLGILGTGLAYIIYYFIIENLGAVAASSVTYIPPVVAIAIGVILVGEDVGVLDYIGTGFIFLGVTLVNQKSAASHSGVLRDKA